MDAMLSTSEVAELTGISLRHVKRLAASNKLPCEKTVNSNNRPKYLFPLSGLAALDPTLPQRYLAQHAQEGTAVRGVTHSRLTGNNGTLEFFLHVAFGAGQGAPELSIEAEQAVERALALPRYHK